MKIFRKLHPRQVLPSCRLQADGASLNEKNSNKTGKQRSTFRIFKARSWRASSGQADDHPEGGLEAAEHFACVGGRTAAEQRRNGEMVLESPVQKLPRLAEVLGLVLEGKITSD